MGLMQLDFLQTNCTFPILLLVKFLSDCLTECPQVQVFQIFPTLAREDILIHTGILLNFRILK